MKWGAHDVELALWSFHYANKLQPDLLKKPSETKGKRRAAGGDTEKDGSSTTNSEEESPSRKKRKY